MILHPKKLWVLPFHLNFVNMLDNIIMKHFSRYILIGANKRIFGWGNDKNSSHGLLITKKYKKLYTWKGACQYYGLGQVLSISQQDVSMNNGISSEALNAIILASFCVIVFIIILMLSLFVCIWCWWLMFLLLPFILVMCCFIAWASLLPSSNHSNNSADDGLTVTQACAPHPRVVLFETTASWRKFIFLNNLMNRSLSSSA